MSKHTPGPWKLIIHGNEKYPFPLSVHTADGEYWIARDGEVSTEANARLIAAAPETAAERDRLREVNAELVEALKAFDVHFYHSGQSIVRCWDRVPAEVRRNIVATVRAAIAKARGQE